MPFLVSAADPPPGNPREIQRALVSQAKRDPLSGRIPGRHCTETRDMFDYWLKPDVFVCQMASSPCAELCGHRENRCGSPYWRNHSAIVAGMLSNLAEDRGEPLDICAVWQAAGLLHDLDHLREPHYDPGHDEDENHPIPLVLTLQARDFPPVLTLAILEHAPHFDLGTSSRMSAALIACDEAATLVAIGEDLSAIPGVPQAVLNAIPQHVEHHAEGRRRENITARMLANFRRMDEPLSSFAVQL